MQNHVHPPSITARENQKITKNRCHFLYSLNSVYSILLLFMLSLSLISIFVRPSSQRPPPIDPRLFPNHQSLRRGNHRLLIINDHRKGGGDDHRPPTPPSVAYLISGSINDTSRILRLLYAVYHPLNQYLIHLDLSASQTDRELIALTIQSVPIFRAAQNVNVVGKVDFVYRNGSTPISATLHSASILLRYSANWDWFINLSASDYPLVTQDDLLHILSYLPKDLNFVEHTGYIGWKESWRYKHIIVDPGLYLSEEDKVFYGTQKRQLPDAYRLFRGSSCAILSRKFLEFCILGVENLPRTLLMYLSNTAFSQSTYFPTVLCNTQQFSRTVVNHSLRYAAAASIDPNLESYPLNSSDFGDMLKSGAAFASPFLVDDPVLDRIDREVLNYSHGRPLPGGWCLAESADDPCSVWGNAEVLRPGPGARRLEMRMIELFSNGTFSSRQCVDE